MGSTNAKQLMLHNAITEDDADKVRELLALDDVDVNSRGEEELTALQLAIVHGSLKSLQVILESGRADLMCLTSEGQSPLILASIKGNEDLALSFMEDFPKNQQLLECVDHHQLQVLHHACTQGQHRLVARLLQSGIPVDTVGGKLRHTPLMLAAQNGHESIVKLLLESGAQRSAVDLAKMNPLHHACMNSNASKGCLQLLLEGVDREHELVDSRDISGCTPLLYCLNNKNRVLEKLLVSHGASLTEALDGGFSEYCYHTLQSSS